MRQLKNKFYGSGKNLNVPKVSRNLKKNTKCFFFHFFKKVLERKKIRDPKILLLKNHKTFGDRIYLIFPLKEKKSEI
jgi:hypothetical protein